MAKKLYLGGPIRFENDIIIKNDTEWRELVANKTTFICHDPTKNNQLNSSQIIGELDFMMLNDSTFGVFSMEPFCKNNYPSIGALVEIGYLLAQNKPVFIMAPADTDEFLKIYEHPMLQRCVFVNNVDEFLDCL